MHILSMYASHTCLSLIHNMRMFPFMQSHTYIFHLCTTCIYLTVFCTLYLLLMHHMHMCLISSIISFHIHVVIFTYMLHYNCSLLLLAFHIGRILWEYLIGRISEDIWTCRTLVGVNQYSCHMYAFHISMSYIHFSYHHISCVIHASVAFFYYTFALLYFSQLLSYHCHISFIYISIIREDNGLNGRIL